MSFRILAAAAALLLSAPFTRAEFKLRDGDTLAFLGDSITAARGYTKLVEHYTLMRFPDRKIQFVNAGQGGDTAFGCLSRLEQDVFARGATVVTVAFGINDIGWGTKANEESKARYLTGIRTIVEQCKARGVRPIICSPAITSIPPDEAETGFLQTMTDEGMELAKSLGAETIDLQRGMREVQRRIHAANAKESDTTKHHHLHVKDGVHLSDLGQLAMGFAMLKGLGAPEEVSSATIDAATEVAQKTDHCQITTVSKLPEGGLTFTREDQGLPITLGAFSVFDFRWVPIPDQLNQYMLTVTNLEAGDYEIIVNGRSLGKTSAERLSQGLNITTMTANPFEPGGPWDAQSLVVKELVDSRDKLSESRNLRVRHLSNHADAATLAALSADLDQKLVELQRATAKPQAYRFEIRKK